MRNTLLSLIIVTSLAPNAFAVVMCKDTLVIVDVTKLNVANDNFAIPKKFNSNFEVAAERVSSVKLVDYQYELLAIRDQEYAELDRTSGNNLDLKRLDNWRKKFPALAEKFNQARIAVLKERLQNLSPDSWWQVLSSLDAQLTMPFVSAASRVLKANELSAGKQIQIISEIVAKAQNREISNNVLFKPDDTSRGRSTETAIIENIFKENSLDLTGQDVLDVLRFFGGPDPEQRGKKISEIVGYGDVSVLKLLNSVEKQELYRELLSPLATERLEKMFSSKVTAAARSGAEEVRLIEFWIDTLRAPSVINERIDSLMKAKKLTPNEVRILLGNKNLPDSKKAFEYIATYYDGPDGWRKALREIKDTSKLGYQNNKNPMTPAMVTDAMALAILEHYDTRKNRLSDQDVIWLMSNFFETPDTVKYLLLNLSNRRLLSFKRNFKSFSDWITGLHQRGIISAEQADDIEGYVLSTNPEWQNQIKRFFEAITPDLI